MRSANSRFIAELEGDQSGASATGAGRASDNSSLADRGSDADARTPVVAFFNEVERALRGPLRAAAVECRPAHAYCGEARADLVDLFDLGAGRRDVTFAIPADSAF